MSKCISPIFPSFSKILLFLIPLFGSYAPAWGQSMGYTNEALLFDSLSVSSETLSNFRYETNANDQLWYGEFIAPGGTTNLIVSAKEVSSWARRYAGEKVLSISGKVAFSNDAIQVYMPKGNWIRVGRPAGYLLVNYASLAEGCFIELVLENEKGETWPYYLGAQWEGLDFPQELYYEDLFPWVEVIHRISPGVLESRGKPGETQLVRLHSINIYPVGIKRQLAGVLQRYSLMTEEQHAQLLAGPPPIAAGESKIELYIRDIRIGW